MCPFCQKATSDYLVRAIPSHLIHNISPILPRHSLIIPKKYIESLFALSDEELAEFMVLWPGRSKIADGCFNIEAFDWAIQEKEVAGQSVAHLHMHVVPRKIGDLPNPGDWYQALERNSQSGIDTYDKFRISREQLKELTWRLKQRAQKT